MTQTYFTAIRQDGYSDDLVLEVTTSIDNLSCEALAEWNTYPCKPAKVTADSPIHAANKRMAHLPQAMSHFIKFVEVDTSEGYDFLEL